MNAPKSIPLLSAALSLLLTSAAFAQARIVEWVETAPSSDSSKIALGYPVPIPVDTPLPFDGFRSYAGLHMRHQDLALTTPWVHGTVIGRTRQGRPIWAYQLGDANHQTVTGQPEQAMLSNAGIHAREWQSPEVATGIIELLASSGSDHHLLDYLRDNANILVIPVLNVDGFLQTQRYPRHNWLGTDLNDPGGSPRDGRMRRKNMLGPDEILNTRGDHLLGVDLNRNNAPYWATNSNRSSSNPESIVHHGSAAGSEPEIQAVDAAAQLGPAAQLSMYTDLHSFSQVHFWTRNDNQRLSQLTDRLLGTFSRHHAAFPADKFYAFDHWNNVPRNTGIGLTAEYFTHAYQVPSWTLEIEPSDGTQLGLPGAGADYGGLVRNSHDGFILPESEVERVRTQLAQTFTVAYYQQSGPPSIRAMRLTDVETGAVVFSADWDPAGNHQRDLYRYQAQPIQLGRDYRAWIAWDKPMRWRTDGTITVLPGQSSAHLPVNRAAISPGGELTVDWGDIAWLDMPGEAPDGYLKYRDDALSYDFRIPSSDENLAALQAGNSATLATGVYDMTGTQGDANPATVAHWNFGAWAGYEDSDGNDDNDQGGIDTSIQFETSTALLGDPFVIEAGTSSAWFDSQRDGEGFVLEILSASQAAMYWFTYDDEGRQDWYIAVGEIRGNRVVFPKLLRVSGGQFGPDFDSAAVEQLPVGSARFIWSSCDSGAMDWVIDGDGAGQPRRQGRMELARLSRVMGIDCGNVALPPEIEAGRLSGSWFDPTHAGEGYVLEIMHNRTALVYWFSYDPEGQRRWFFGTGTIDGKVLRFEKLQTTSGGVFGAPFDPDAVSRSDWGSLELELECETGTARFEPVEAGFASGELSLQRLTFLDGLNCDSEPDS